MQHDCLARAHVCVCAGVCAGVHVCMCACVHVYLRMQPNQQTHAMRVLHVLRATACGIQLCPACQHALHSTLARVGGLVGVLVMGWYVGTVHGWVGECGFLLVYGTVCAYGGMDCFCHHIVARSKSTRCQNKINSLPAQHSVHMPMRPWLLASRPWLIASRSHTPPHDATPVTLSSGRFVGGLFAAINRVPLEIAASFVRHTTFRVILPFWTRTPLLTAGGVGIWMTAVA